MRITLENSDEIELGFRPETDVKEVPSDSHG